MVQCRPGKPGPTLLLQLPEAEVGVLPAYFRGFLQCSRQVAQQTRFLQLFNRVQLLPGGHTSAPQVSFIAVGQPIRSGPDLLYHTFLSKPERRSCSTGDCQHLSHLFPSFHAVSYTHLTLPTNREV